MITLEEAAIMGINAPKSHQRVIGKLMTRLGTLFYDDGAIALEPLPETMIDEDKSSPVPDIMLYDNLSYRTPVIIEITRTGSVENDLEKVRELIETTRYGIQEGFVYDYNRNEWHKYKRGAGDILENPSFCEAINLDLAALL